MPDREIRSDAAAFNRSLRIAQAEGRESVRLFREFLASPEMRDLIVADRLADAKRRETFRARPHVLTDDEPMEPGTARCVRRVSWLLSEARVYKLSEPVAFDGGETRFVVVSDRGFEAMAFTCDAAGELMPDGEHNSVDVGRDGHESAITAMGFRVVDSGEALPLESAEAANDHA